MVSANVPSRGVHRGDLNVVCTEPGFSPARGGFGRPNEIGHVDLDMFEHRLIQRSLKSQNRLIADSDGVS